MRDIDELVKESKFNRWKKVLKSVGLDD